MITENEAPSWDLLAEVALARRNRLGMTQRGVADSGGPSAPTVRALETQSSMMTPRTLRKLETALGWTVGTAATLVDGTQPEAQADWPAFVSQCIHAPPDTHTTAQPLASTALEPALEPPTVESSADREEALLKHYRDRYEQLDISLSHATFLLSQLKHAKESGDDDTFHERATSLHHLIRSMHYSVMQELAS